MALRLSLSRFIGFPMFHRGFDVSVLPFFRAAAQKALMGNVPP